MALFFTEDFSEANPFLSTAESYHLAKVLRMKNADTLQVTDGKGNLYECIITNLSEKSTQVAIVKKYPDFGKRNFYIHLAVAPTKNIDRIEWLIEKCTEIGVDEISFLLSQRSERKQIRIDRLEKITVEAIKQSKRAFLPKINDLQTFENFVKNNTNSYKFIAHVADENRLLLTKTALPKQNYCVLIGPEGDFSELEISFAKEFNFIPVSLGENRLRTETAGLVACHTLHLINEL
ncbi:MAG: 16S rRNA (uracil(1498)-N(3))-methyltransferase [Verrucomicrobia bacterium]|nr:16S rRNA (uracil(1498)-N(3))-methyltransferase [Cytophagales bacterium]